jgi:putative flavoprotein involved in K+ transport
LTFADGAYRLDATGGPYRARSVIVATGAYQRPYIPDLAHELAAHIHQCHSSTYRSPAALPAGEVLVVGAGNSGAQIAMELADAGRTVWLPGRDTGSIPRRLLGRDVYDWLWWTVMRLTKRSRIGRRLMAGQLTLGDPLVGLTRRDLEARGIGRVGRTVGSVDGRPVLDDGRVLEHTEAVVWCTGFRPEFTWIDLPIVDSRGYPRHDRGLAVDAPGLGFVGLRYQHRLASSLLGGVGADAAYVVRHLVAGTRSTA